MIDTWTCHICKKERADELISVLTHDMSEGYKLPPGTFTENVRYCNDDFNCMKQAERYSHFSKDEKAALTIKKKGENKAYTLSSDDTFPGRSKLSISKYIIVFIGVFLLMTIINTLITAYIFNSQSFSEALLDPVRLVIRMILAVFVSLMIASSIFKK